MTVRSLEVRLSVLSDLPFAHRPHRLIDKTRSNFNFFWFQNKMTSSLTQFQNLKNTIEYHRARSLLNRCFLLHHIRLLTQINNRIELLISNSDCYNQYWKFSKAINSNCLQGLLPHVRSTVSHNRSSPVLIDSYIPSTTLIVRPPSYYGEFNKHSSAMHTL